MLAGVNDEVEQLTLVIDDDMKLETEEPSHGAFTTLGYAFENPVVVNPLVVADFQRCGINVRNTGTLAEKHLLDENGQMKQY